MIKNIFFDLDGTITDPIDGITNCINYSLEKLEEPTRPEAELIQFIGPPLRQNYATLLTTNNESLIEKAVALYRERFSTIGLYENALYEGIADILAELKANDLRLFIATSKPTVYSKKIIAHFSLDRYFEDVFGSELDGRFDNKSELVAYIIDKLNLVPAETVMIGDREVDIIAGKSNGTKTIAATYGYGSEKELLGCLPDHICHSPGQIPALIRDYQSRITII